MGAQKGALPSLTWSEITGIGELSCSQQKLGLALAVDRVVVALPATPVYC